MSSGASSSASDSLSDSEPSAEPSEAAPDGWWVVWCVEEFAL